MEQRLLRTVADLIEELKKLPPDAIPISVLPSFDGVRLLPQNSGKVLIAPTQEPR